MTDLQRVKKIVKWLIFEEYGENEREISELMGYNPSSFSQIMNGKVPISDNFINKLCVISRDINKNWILTGEGEMLKSEKATYYAQGNLVGGNLTQGNGTMQQSLGQEQQALQQQLEALQRENSLLKDKIIKLMEEKLGL